MTIFIAIFLLVLPTIGYFLVLAIAAQHAPARPILTDRLPTTRFAIAIPAHDEASVIEATVGRLKCLNYPAELFTIHIVADHCTDNTAGLARQVGAVAHERNHGPRLGKGAALAWLFERILSDPYDAVVVFDADTRADPDFLRLMDARLAQGAQVVQGQHIIRNSQSGWFPALTWAMFLIDNRFQNLGRANLGWSAKNMGDSICFRADILRRLGWGEGLTEDYHLRQLLLLDGIKISYERFAYGYGEAPRTWARAKAQRARWLRGTRNSSRQLAYQLLREGVRRRDLALLDGAVQSYLPSFSTVTLICAFAIVVELLLAWLIHVEVPAWHLVAWVGAVLILFLYPLFGLALEKAPARAYFVILTGPLFIVWRTVLAIRARYSRQPDVWVRTAHGEVK